MKRKKVRANKDENSIIFVDSRGRKWNKACLNELLNSLYQEADSEQVKKYFIKGKYSF